MAAGDRARVVEQADERLGERGLPRSGFAEQAVRLAALDGERDVVEGVDVAVGRAIAGREGVEFEEHHSTSVTSSTACPTK
ncbi:hypothetical protein MBEHAL_1619 [Halarchaeum acidiphilum MH1-52-1]|uniref:Uncharacterized protein n=1 Tax=Halarchaeum acidiphilum MH1-52-1 TaxID=1261545 RepID=U3A5F4_9EURY|nr:hypothetical protein MBEHAL_1619 [Halarchaeum acidiphilum MH1-52-1]